MKRVVLLVLVLILMLSTHGVLAFDYSTAIDDYRIYDLGWSIDIHTLSFEKMKFETGKYLEVYSGPGENYYRCADGKAGVSTDGEIFCAGRDGRWMMIEYVKNDGVKRIGYIDTKKLKRVPDCSEIPFEDIPAFTSRNTYLMDAPTRKAECIAMLERRQPVTLLAWHADIHGNAQADYWSGLEGWAYIETDVDGQRMRGFIDPHALDRYQIGDELKNIGKVTEEKLKEVYAFRYKYLKEKAAIAAWDFAAGITQNGTISIVGNNQFPEIESWNDLVAIDMGADFVVGLKSNGTVVAAGSNEFGQCDIGEWADIVAIAAGEFHTAGLKADGTVVMTGNTDYRQDCVRAWDNIVNISAGAFYTVGLRADGAVLVAGAEYNSENENMWLNEEYVNIEPQWPVEYWNKPDMLDAEGNSTVGLHYMDTVMVVGDYLTRQHDAEVWEDIVRIAVCNGVVYGLDISGNLMNTCTEAVVEGWDDVNSLVAGKAYVLGIQDDGKVLFAEGEVYSDEREHVDKMKNDIAKWDSVIGLSKSFEVFGH